MTRILVVEDESDIATVLEGDLELEGYEVKVVGDGEAAIRLARGNPFDLILLDVMLPGKAGFEVCRELRRAGLRMPIILLTAKTQEAEKVLGGWTWARTTTSRSLSARKNSVPAFARYCGAPRERCRRCTASAMWK